VSLISELKRRKVFRVAGAYAVVGWLVIEVAATIAPQLNFPEWVPRLITFVILLGFPVALVTAWMLEVTPEGVKMDAAGTGSKRIYVIAAVFAALALGWYIRDLRHAPQASPDDARSIAVLPFVNMSADPEQEYFSEGIAEELLNRLAQYPDLKVAARTSAFQFKGKNLDIGEIGRRLKVTHVLEGSVRKGGSTLRITAQLIDSRTGYHMWSESYDRDAADVLRVQDEIAGAIAKALESRLGGKAVASAPALKVSPEAYDDYLQGRAFVAKRRVENLDKAIAAFDRAIALEPGYSAAYSGRGFAHLLRPMWNAPDFQSALASARDSADRALQFDPDNAEAYMVRGTAEAFGRDAASARIDLDRAQTLAPGSVDVINMTGDVDMYFGALGEAERLKRRAMALDPLAFVHPMNLSDVLYAQGRYQEAIAAAKQSISLGARDTGLDRLVNASLRAGRAGQARDAVEQVCAMIGATSWTCETDRIVSLAAAGQRKQAKALLDELAGDFRDGKRPADTYVPAVLAAYYVEISDFTGAAAWQRKALDGGSWFPTFALVNAPGGAKLPEEMSADPEWLAVWNDPRMQDVMTVYRRNLVAWRASRR